MAALAISGIGDKRMKNIRKINSYLKVYIPSQTTNQVRGEIKTFSDLQLLKKFVFHILLFRSSWKMCTTIMRENQERGRPRIEETEDITAQERNEGNSQAPDRHQEEGEGAVQIGAGIRASEDAVPRN